MYVRFAVRDADELVFRQTIGKQGVQPFTSPHSIIPQWAFLRSFVNPAPSAGFSAVLEREPAGGIEMILLTKARSAPASDVGLSGRRTVVLGGSHQADLERVRLGEFRTEIQPRSEARVNWGPMKKQANERFQVRGFPLPVE